MPVGTVSSELVLDIQKFKKSLDQAAQLVKKFGSTFDRNLSVSSKTLLPIVKLLAQIRDTSKSTAMSLARLFNKTAGEAVEAKYRVKDVIRELQKLQDVSKKGVHMYPKEVQGPKKDTVFSKEWFLARSVWFLQLRGAWAAYEGVKTAVKDVLSLNEALTNLRAITGGSAEQVETMRVAIQEAATQTKFYAAEVADAATKLAQAGFSFQEVANMVQPISVLASATNRDLQVATDVLTTVMKAWTINSEQADAVVNTLSAGVSKARLQLEDLSVAMSYMGTASAQLGMSVEDTVAWLGVLRDVGLEASQAGTAFRRIAAEFSKDVPTQRMARALERVGLQWKDLNFYAGGLNDALRKLRDSGISVVEVLGASQARTGAVLAAMIEHIDKQERLTKEITGTNKAYEMNKIQMSAVNNIMRQTWSLVGKFTDIVSGAGTGLEGFAKDLNNVTRAFLSLGLVVDYVLGILQQFRDAIIDRMVDFWLAVWDTIKGFQEEGYSGAIEAIKMWSAIFRKNMEDDQKKIKNDFNALIENIKSMWTELEDVKPKPGKIYGEGKGLGAVPLPPDPDEDKAKKKAPKAFRSYMTRLDRGNMQQFKQQLDDLRAVSERSRAMLTARGFGIIGAEQRESLELAAMREKKDLLEEQMSLYASMAAKENALENDTRDLEEGYNKLSAELIVTNAELTEQQRLMVRGPFQSFRDGIKRATEQMGTWNRVLEQAGATVQGIAVDTLAEGLNNVGDALAGSTVDWREWARSVISSLRDVASQLFATWVLKSAFGGLGFAHGGVAPNFRRFAGGGITSGPAFALLGDNPSKKELVIPSENIHKDSVRGYTREKESKGDIAILNVVDPSMMVSMMGSMQGKQIIINAINEDVLRRGPSYSVVRGVR